MINILTRENVALYSGFNENLNNWICIYGKLKIEVLAKSLF